MVTNQFYSQYAQIILTEPFFHAETLSHSVTFIVCRINPVDKQEFDTFVQMSMAAQRKLGLD